MTTSSGRTRWCVRCGHYMNEHARVVDSKCTKCNKAFVSCQSRGHQGWRLCFIPCSCGAEYYPDKARAAVPLASHEYRKDHAGYRALPPGEDKYNTTADQASSSTDQGVRHAGRTGTRSTKSGDPFARDREEYEDGSEGSDPGSVSASEEERSSGKGKGRRTKS